MEKIGDILAARGDFQENFYQLSVEILANPEIAAFVSAHQLTDDQLSRSFAKFQEYLTESAKKSGYQPTLVMNEGFVDVSYRETVALKTQREESEQLRRVALVGLPKALRAVSWDEVKADNASQAQAYQKVVNFVAQFPEAKGLYLYGRFGIGKSFMMAAMANSLAKHGVETTLLHYPTFLAETNYDNVAERVARVKKVQVLVLDDIGAEVNSAWTRDSILQVVLQYRMDNRLPTFFTSNFSMTELQQHFSETRNVADSWPAERLMERIRFLSEEVFMEGENRRQL